MPVEVTDEDFAEVVLAADRLAVVDFWAEWCQPCTIMAAYMGHLLMEYGERIVVAALDVEENADTSAKYGIQGLPTVILFRDGTEIDRHIGVRDYESLRRQVEQWLVPFEASGDG